MLKRFWCKLLIASKYFICTCILVNTYTVKHFLKYKFITKLSFENKEVNIYIDCWHCVGNKIYNTGQWQWILQHILIVAFCFKLKINIFI